MHLLPDGFDVFNKDNEGRRYIYIYINNIGWSKKYNKTLLYISTVKLSII